LAFGIPPFGILKFGIPSFGVLTFAITTFNIQTSRLKVKAALAAWSSGVVFVFGVMGREIESRQSIGW
jgi:hypothetical protein